MEKYTIEIRIDGDNKDVKSRLLKTIHDFIDEEMKENDLVSVNISWRKRR